MIPRLFHSLLFSFARGFRRFLFVAQHAKGPPLWLAFVAPVPLLRSRLPSVRSFRAPREKKQSSHALSLSLHARSFVSSFFSPSSFPTLFPLFLWTVATLLIQGSSAALVYPRPVATLFPLGRASNYR